VALGEDRLVIGAYEDMNRRDGVGAAYLFSTNGNLLTTFTNPMPSRPHFSASLTVVSGDKLLHQCLRFGMEGHGFFLLGVGVNQRERGSQKVLTHFPCRTVSLSL